MHSQWLRLRGLVVLSLEERACLQWLQEACSVVSMAELRVHITRIISPRRSHQARSMAPQQPRQRVSGPLEWARKPSLRDDHLLLTMGLLLTHLHVDLCISIRGNWPLFPNCDTIIPHARTMKDMFSLLDVIVAKDENNHCDFWREQPFVPLPDVETIRPKSYHSLTDKDSLKGKKNWYSEDVY
jgi:hypothetical protein